MGIFFNSLTQADFFSVKFSGDPVQEEKFNFAVKEWATKTKEILISNVDEKTTKGKRSTIYKENGSIIEKKLGKSIGFHLNKTKKGNVTERVRFAFERHGVYLEKGVGKGIRNKNEWFNKSIDNQIDELADIAVDNGVKLNFDGFGIRIR